MGSARCGFLRVCLYAILITGALTQQLRNNKFRNRQRGRTPQRRTAVGSNQQINHANVRPRGNFIQSNENAFPLPGRSETARNKQEGNNFGGGFNDGLDILLSSYKDGHIGSVPRGGYLEVPTLSQLNSPMAYRPDFTHDDRNSLIKNTRRGQHIRKGKQENVSMRNFNRGGNRFFGRHQNRNRNNVDFSVQNKNQFDRRIKSFDNRRQEQGNWRNNNRAPQGNTQNRNQHRSQNMVTNFHRSNENFPAIRASNGRSIMDRTQFQNNAATRKFFGGVPIPRRHSRVFNNQI